VCDRLHDVEGFDNLRWEDQKKLEKYVQDSGGSLEDDDEEEDDEEQDEEDKDFLIEYAKSSRSTCKECEEKIQKDEVGLTESVAYLLCWGAVAYFGVYPKSTLLPSRESLRSAFQTAVYWKGPGSFPFRGSLPTIWRCILSASLHFPLAGDPNVIG
jgi:hypothetical protein